MALRHLRRVFLQFSAGDPAAVSARELLARFSGDKARKSNPECAVEFSIDDESRRHGSAFLDLTFADGTTMRLRTADYAVDELARLIDNKGQEIELQSVLSQVKGFDPWKPDNRLGMGPPRG